MATSDKTTEQDSGMTDLEKALQGIGAGEDGGAGGAPDDGKDTPLADRLRACQQQLAVQHTFKRGQLVQWKKRMKNRRTPEYGKPVIVVDVLETPIYDTASKGAGTPYFREPLTLVAGRIHSDGDFICFHYDGRRFEPYQE